MSIRLEHVSYAYEDNSSKKNYALKDINLEIKKEEFIAVIGHTGSGKSTLIQHLNGLIKPTSGTIYFDDEDIYSEGYPLRELRGCMFWSNELWKDKRRSNRDCCQMFKRCWIIREIISKIAI